MPTIFAHALVPLALRVALGRAAVPPRLLAAGALAAVAPDFDSVAFLVGIPYADAFGHRGASHSLAFALAVGGLGALAARWLGTTRRRAFAVLAFCTASHPLLDALTNGGLGVALLWPWSEARLFAPWRPIAVSPIGAGFFSARGLAVLGSESMWVVAPLAAMAAGGWLLRRGLAWMRADVAGEDADRNGDGAGRGGGGSGVADEEAQRAGASRTVAGEQERRAGARPTIGG